MPSTTNTLTMAFSSLSTQPLKQQPHHPHPISKTDISLPVPQRPILKENVKYIDIVPQPDQPNSTQSTSSTTPPPTPHHPPISKASISGPILQHVILKDDRKYMDVVNANSVLTPGVTPATSPTSNRLSTEAQVGLNDNVLVHLHKSSTSANGITQSNPQQQQQTKSPIASIKSSNNSQSSTSPKKQIPTSPSTHQQQPRTLFGFLGLTPSSPIAVPPSSNLDRKPLQRSGSIGHLGGVRAAGPQRGLQMDGNVG
ncbi:hypothetical protein HDU76_011516, partial [Blyttiomyces sp. JEL0837]